MLGRDQDDELMLYDWEAFGLFTYEVLCDIGKRVPRVYLKDGEVVGTHDMTEEMYRDFILKQS
jgi:alanine racemase